MFDEFDTNLNNRDNDQLSYEVEEQKDYTEYTDNFNNTSYNFWTEKSEESEGYNYTEDYLSPILNEEKANENSNYIQMNRQGTFIKKGKKESKIKKFLKFAALSILFGILAGAGFQGFHEAYKAFFPEAIQAFKQNDGNASLLKGGKVELTTIEGEVTKLQTDISEVVENAMPSIVSIDITREVADGFWNNFYREVPGSGSGIIVGMTDDELFIVTNNHVIDGAVTLKVTFIDEVQVDAEVKGTDTGEDLAVITIDIDKISEESLSAIKVAKLGDSDEVKVGQMAIAIGNALGYGQSVTAGYISAKNRTVNVEGNTMVLLQTDAAINPGNSGGALLNIEGEVIGINAVKYAYVEGMGYAIPISSATPIINELISKEIIKESERGFLGVSGEDVTEEISEQLNIPMGVYITNIVDNSAAMKAGLYVGDIVTAINGELVLEFEELRNIISGYKVGTVVELTIQRSMQGVFNEQTITITLGKRIE